MAKFQVPNLENATPGFLIDQLAQIRAKKNLLKKLEDIFMTALKSRTSDDDWRNPIQGDMFQAERQSYGKHAVDQTAVKEFAENPQVRAALAAIGIDVDKALFADTVVTMIRTNGIPGMEMPENYQAVDDDEIFKEWGLKPLGESKE